ncbi:uncharacterized protein [Anoplolepis gracilipes]|uniref:uncharacterized protein n=1 Tax=Anoplolepis gracilipes TaxID=354296 RepID=UPI003B9F044C
MVGCTIPFCNNSAQKGYNMKMLPTNIQRRNQWINNINNKYPNWTPSKNSYLCEVHFEPEMWEKRRIDGKKKLKPNAVPTIFEYFQKEKLHFYINNEKSNLDIIEQELVNEENQIIINDKQIMHDKIKVKEKNNSEEIIKVNSFQDIDKECGLVLDEMNISPKYVYDSSTKTLLGNITLSHEEGIATHALTFMLTGIAKRWKHVVGYFYTGDSFNGETVKNIIFQIIQKAEEIGLHVNYITSDMGPGNGKIWKCCGINVGRHSDVRNCMSHPYALDRFLYFIADIPHLLKNLKEALVSNGFFILPDEFVQKYNLPSNRVEITHFNELIEFQKDLEFLLTPRLQYNDVNYHAVQH